jgi:predicted GNAT family N-acyltransferase
MPSTESPDTIIEEFLLRLERDGLSAVVVVDVNPAESGGLSLDRIVVDEQQRGHGVANRVVSVFVQLCDDYAQDAEVIPKPLDPRTTREGLERLYGRHGFHPVSPGIDSLMRRPCRPVPASK